MITIPNLKIIKSIAVLFVVTFNIGCKNSEVGYSTSPNEMTVETYLGEGAAPEDFYNRENKIYKIGKEFVFSYFLLKGGDSVQMREIKRVGKEYDYFAVQKSWDLVGIHKSDSNKVSKFSITPTGGTPSFTNGEYWPQTLSDYYYYSRCCKMPFSESTGIIDNEKNIWLHPPRQLMFSILELNPFPYIKFPLKIGSSWKWQLTIGQHYGDERWATWEGNIDNEYLYTITDKTNYHSPYFGKLKCYVVEAVANSELGETALTAYYNKKYGFVKFLYTNIDGSKLVIDLEEVVDKK